MEELLAQIDQELLPAQSKEVFDTLGKIFGNIVGNPTEPKFRSLKKENKVITEKLGKSNGAVSLLLAVGFEDSGSTYTCPEAAPLDNMQIASDLIQCIILSRDDGTAPAAKRAAPPAAATGLAAATIVGGVIQKPGSVAAPKAAPKAAEKDNFARRGADPQKAQADQLQAVRAAAAQRAHNGASTSDGSSAAPQVAASADAKKAPVKSAFDFESRAAREQKSNEAAGSLEEMRRAQKEKYNKFADDPDAAKGEAYQRPPSVAAGGTSDQSWGGWAAGGFGMFGGGSSSSGGGAPQDKPDRPKGGFKTISDLPKPVQRG